MAYWLIKSEPSVYSWDDLVRDGSTVWDGVRNYAARNNLRSMKKNEEVLYYHSNEGLEIVGIARISKEAFQDPSTIEEAWVAVEIKPVKPLPVPVSLVTIRNNVKFKDMALVKLSRLSVQPVTSEEWKQIMALSKK